MLATVCVNYIIMATLVFAHTFDYYIYQFFLRNSQIIPLPHPLDPDLDPKEKTGIINQFCTY
jgi:hypothetical protein